MTVIEAGPCTVVAGEDADARTATPPCSSASARRSATRVARPMRGHVARRPARAPFRVLREFRVARTATSRRSAATCTVGDVFEAGDSDRRHRRQQGPRLRRRHEAPPLQRLSRRRTARTSTSGTAARSATARIPGRVFKGKRMAGRMGDERVTTHEPRGRRGARRREPAAGARRGPGRAERHGRSSAGRRRGDGERRRPSRDAETSRSTSPS